MSAAAIAESFPEDLPRPVSVALPGFSPQPLPLCPLTCCSLSPLLPPATPPPDLLSRVEQEEHEACAV